MEGENKNMTLTDITEILKIINKGKDLDDLTMKEIRESHIAVTGLVVGLLLGSGKTVEEVKEIIK